MPAPVLVSGLTPRTVVHSQLKRVTTAWLRLVPARTPL